MIVFDRMAIGILFVHSTNLHTYSHTDIHYIYIIYSIDIY